MPTAKKFGKRIDSSPPIAVAMLIAFFPCLAFLVWSLATTPSTQMVVATTKTYPFQIDVSLVACILLLICGFSGVGSNGPKSRSLLLFTLAGIIVFGILTGLIGYGIWHHETVGHVQDRVFGVVIWFFRGLLVVGFALTCFCQYRLKRGTWKK